MAGTKQIRIGKLAKLLDKIDKRLDRWESERGCDAIDKAREIVAELREEFELPREGVTHG